jgi:hypothetical protein
MSTGLGLAWYSVIVQVNATPESHPDSNKSLSGIHTLQCDVVSIQLTKEVDIRSTAFALEPLDKHLCFWAGSGNTQALLQIVMPANGS